MIEEKVDYDSLPKGRDGDVLLATGHTIQWEPIMNQEDAAEFLGINVDELYDIPREILDFDHPFMIENDIDMRNPLWFIEWKYKEDTTIRNYLKCQVEEYKEKTNG